MFVNINFVIDKALSAIDIQKALNNLVSPSELEAKAVDARQEIDLKVITQKSINQSIINSLF